jgi:hypothetical protein
MHAICALRCIRRIQFCSLQAHTNLEPAKALGINKHMLSQVSDADGPLLFWQTSCPLKKTLCKMLREVALRMLPGKASALGVERLWSGAKLTLVDNRRSLLTPRLMQLLKLKMNLGLLGDSDMHLLESLGVKQMLEDDDTFDSIFQDLEKCEEEESWKPPSADIEVSIAGQSTGEHHACGASEEQNSEEEDDDPFVITGAALE